MLVKTKEELEALLKRQRVNYNGILEEENLFYVFTPSGVRKFLKPRNRKKVLETLQRAGFPESVLTNLGRDLDTLPLRTVNTYLKRGFWKKGFGLVFMGAPGIGKTHSLTKTIAVLLKNQIVHQPVYIPFTELSNEEIRARLDLYDAVLLDDINVSLPDWKIQLLEEILFQLYNRRVYIFLTSNSSKEELKTLLSGAIWSRLEERCIFQEFPVGEDVRKRLKKESLGV